MKKINNLNMYFVLVVLIFVTISSSNAQLAKPVIDTSNVGWGWFDLKMKGNSVQPKNTQWVITEVNANIVVFNSLRDCSQCTDDSCLARCTNGITADTRDLTSKRIIGCSASTNYSAKVRYNDGVLWSNFSEPVSFNTQDEPVYHDTVNIVLWGHSTLTMNSNTVFETSIREGDQGQDGFLAPNDDSFGHSLQTALRKLTGKRVCIINRAEGGSRQSRWLRSGVGSDIAIDDNLEKNYRHLDSTYDAGGSYSDHKKFPLAVFVFGQNDARSGWCDPDPWYPAQNFDSDARKIFDMLTSKGVTVVYNSIHYAFPHSCTSGIWEGAPYDRQVAYYNTWQSLMNEIPQKNSRIIRGFDFFSLFQSDTARYLCLDRIHTNLSEGIPGMVEPLALIIADAIKKVTSVEERKEQPNNFYLGQNYPNPFNPSTTIEYTIPALSHVQIEIYNVLGAKILTLIDQVIDAGTHRCTWNANGMDSGTYFYRLSASGIGQSIKFVKTKTLVLGK